MGPCRCFKLQGSLLWPGTAEPWGHLVRPNSASPHMRIFLFQIVSESGSISLPIFLQKTCPIGSWQIKLFPSLLPDFSCIPQRLGDSEQLRGSLHALIANFWWSHNFTTTDIRQAGTVSEQICSRGLPLLLAQVIPRMTFCIWTHCRKALVRWSQQCLYKS